MLKKGTTIKLDTEDNDKLVYTLKLDGKDVTPADLKEGDVFEAFIIEEYKD